MRLRMNMKALLSWLLFIVLAMPAWAQGLDPVAYEDGFQVRKRQLINNMADVYAPRAPGFRNTGVPDPEKFNWPAVVALFDKYGLSNDTANARIRRFANNQPFHFTLVGMARIMEQYAQAPAMVQTRNTYLDRVWGRTDSYNAFYSEGTENHNNMSKPSGYLYAQYSLGNSRYPQAATKLAEMKQWILDFSKLMSVGGHGEWNSSTYNTWSVAGWLNLYDFAQDPDVKLCARAVLDYYAIEMAVNYTNGLTGGAEMRGNALESVATDSDFLNWLWFDDSPRTVGQLFFNSRSNSRISATYAAVSSYRPPLMAVELARKQLQNKSTYKIGYPDYLMLRQGHIPAQMYVDDDFTLGSAIFRYGGFTGGDFQAVSFKLAARVANGDSLKTAQVLTGCGRYWGNTGGRSRQPYDQYVQHNNVVMQMTLTPANDAALYNAFMGTLPTWRTDWQRDFTSRFPGDGKPNPVNGIGTSLPTQYRNGSYMSWPRAGVTVFRRNKVVFLQMERVFVALRSIGQDSGAIRNETNARLQLVDSASYGSLCGLIVEARNASEFSSFGNFQDSILIKTSLDKSQMAAGIITYTNLKGEQIEATYQANGQFDEPVYDWGYGVTSQSINQNLAAWQIPTWAAGPNNGRVPTWKINGVAANTTYTGIEGPNVLYRNNIARLQDVGRFYNIDYTGPLPVFTTNTTGLATSLGKDKEPILWPNPAAKSVQIGLYADSPCQLIVSLYSMNGKMIKRYQPISLGEAGGHSPTLSLQDVNEGQYICRIEAGKQRWSKRLVVVR